VLVVALTAAAAAAFFLGREKASDLWDSTRDTASSWGETAAGKAEDVAETVGLTQ